eukprot:m.226130 g.226130  ORF g.226130 m.226130 type:complete len:600 (+) comp16882_c0_seq1:14035-15834(+)
MGDKSPVAETPSAASPDTPRAKELDQASPSEENKRYSAYDSDEEEGDDGAAQESQSELPVASESDREEPLMPASTVIKAPTILCSSPPQTPTRAPASLVDGEIVHEPINSHRAHRMSTRRPRERIESPSSQESRSTTSSSTLGKLHNNLIFPESGAASSSLGSTMLSCASLGVGGDDKDTISVYLVTWNMHEQDFPLSLGPLLFADGSGKATHHIYAIATQEGTMARRDWELKIQETLGPTYVIVHSAFLMGIHLCLVVHRDLTWDISYVESSTVATKMGGMLNTKGGVGIAMHVRGNSFLFVDSHLAAHSKHTQQRNDDFHTIIRNFSFPRTTAIHTRITRAAAAGTLSTPQLARSTAAAAAAVAAVGGASTPAPRAAAGTPLMRSVLPSIGTTSQSSAQSEGRNSVDMFDVIFWLGDLNYRIDMPRSTVIKAVGRGEWAVLRTNDQLFKEQTAGRVFAGFTEGPIEFPPTFKYDLGTDDFDTSAKQRVPSWTDRILVRGSATCHRYGSVTSLKVSDHRPVFAVYTAAAGQGRTLLPEECTVVDFDREALSECRKRSGYQRDHIVPIAMRSMDPAEDRHRATLGDAIRYKSSVICTIS